MPPSFPLDSEPCARLGIRLQARRLCEPQRIRTSMRPWPHAFRILIHRRPSFPGPTVPCCPIVELVRSGIFEAPSGRSPGRSSGIGPRALLHECGISDKHLSIGRRELLGSLNEAGFSASLGLLLLSVDSRVLGYSCFRIWTSQVTSCLNLCASCSDPTIAP